MVFWLTLIPGALAVLALLALVEDPEHSPNPSLKFLATLRGLPARFKRYLVAVGLFGLGDFSHSLLILDLMIAGPEGGPSSDMQRYEG